MTVQIKLKTSALGSVRTPLSIFPTPTPAPPQTCTHTNISLPTVCLGVGRAGGTPQRCELSISPSASGAPALTSYQAPGGLWEAPSPDPAHSRLPASARLLGETLHPLCKAAPGRGGQGQCPDLQGPPHLGPHPHHLLHGACPAPQLTGVCVLMGRRGRSSLCPHRSRSLPPSPPFLAKTATLALVLGLVLLEITLPTRKGLLTAVSSLCLISPELSYLSFVGLFRKPRKWT